MAKGMAARAVEIFERLLEQNFHSLSEIFIPYYTRNGQRGFALVLADIKFQRSSAPVIEWIRAIEDPAADHSAGLARFREWENQSDVGIGLAEQPLALLAFRAYEEFSEARFATYIVWHPDARDFRATAYFKQFIRDTGILAYWQEHEFPKFCRAVGDDDFECDQPN
jgi:hypothetical protein